MSENFILPEGYHAIGTVLDITDFPASITIGNDPYFILRTVCKGDEQPTYKLVSAVCPHAGGEVRPLENELICPLHYWSFDAGTGESTNVPGERLACSPVVIHNGQFTITSTP
ncbi:Rieske (2Fe-2S) protein [Paenibacillus sp. sptzw28]|uniref:Rieske (2Fe-2S) protein n=1 Tax=Paenibacillus sp. sptzw28 TaxID=715179 RepID=UPI001C6DE604|nr:Rieske (2Fe-2S) protein [Paenibacillus sp. sptzw28]QYR20454.1 Rieske (2Fe-2S) protein [Paenibacillus sp. sptzw28]